MVPDKPSFPSDANDTRCQLTAAKDRKGRIAQLVEQLTLNQRVVGSNPTAPTKVSEHWEDVGEFVSIVWLTIATSTHAPENHVSLAQALTRFSMSWIPESGWLNTLEKISARTAAIIALFGATGLVAAAYNWPDPAPSAIKWIFATSLFLGGAIMIAHCIAYVSRRVVEHRTRERKRLAALEVEAAREQAILRNLGKYILDKAT
jgi:hypothetical protein